MIRRSGYRATEITCNAGNAGDARGHRPVVRDRSGPQTQSDSQRHRDLRTDSGSCRMVGYSAAKRTSKVRNRYVKHT